MGPAWPAGHGGPPLSAALAGMLLLPLLQAGRGCSTPCFCFATPDTLQCRLGRLLEPPSGLPASVRNLSIVGGNLTVLRPAAFAGGLAGDGEAAAAAARPLAQLTLLLLTHDGIEALQGAAFAGLPALATLDLSHNRLRAVAAAAFAGCAQLRTLRLNQALAGRDAGALLGGALSNLSLARLELAGNRLRQLPPGAALPPGLRTLDARNNSLQALGTEQLDGLAALGRPRLLLAANPLRCDCASLRPLLAWLRNASAAVDPSLLCASPPALQGRPLRRLRASQLGCRGEDAADADTLGLPDEDAPETASYVFFAIVLALIGLVFLMVLYLNRKGIKRWLNNLRDACRDQMEGYHYRYEQDCDPRRAAGPGDL